MTSACSETTSTHSEAKTATNFAQAVVNQSMWQLGRTMEADVPLAWVNPVPERVLSLIAAYGDSRCAWFRKTMGAGTPLPLVSVVRT